MLPDVISALRCPACRLPLAEDGGARGCGPNGALRGASGRAPGGAPGGAPGRALTCASGHSFDVARQGYVNLLGGGAHTGTADTAAMVEARAAFLEAGHFAPIASALAAAAPVAVPADAPGLVIDVGAGTGYYLAAVLDRLDPRTGLALDISKHAARRAARAHPRMAAAVCDAWDRLPVADGVAALVMSVFAPRNGAEFARVLAPGGALITVTPTGRHLAGLVDPLGLVTVDERKEERLAYALGAYFERVALERVERALALDHTEIASVVGMGPSARHVDANVLAARVAALPEPVPVALSVAVATWSRR